MGFWDGFELNTATTASPKAKPKKQGTGFWDGFEPESPSETFKSAGNILKAGDKVAGMSILAGVSTHKIHFGTHDGPGVYDISEKEAKRKYGSMEKAADALAEQGFVVAVRYKGQKNIGSNHLHFADPQVADQKEVTRLQRQGALQKEMDQEAKRQKGISTGKQFVSDLGEGVTDFLVDKPIRYASMLMNAAEVGAGRQTINAAEAFNDPGYEPGMPDLRNITLIKDSTKPETMVTSKAAKKLESYAEKHPNTILGNRAEKMGASFRNPATNEEMFTDAAFFAGGEVLGPLLGAAAKTRVLGPLVTPILKAGKAIDGLSAPVRIPAKLVEGGLGFEAINLGISGAHAVANGQSLGEFVDQQKEALPTNMFTGMAFRVPHLFRGLTPQQIRATEENIRNIHDTQVVTHGQADPQVVRALDEIQQAIKYTEKGSATVPEGAKPFTVQPGETINEGPSRGKMRAFREVEEQMLREDFERNMPEAGKSYELPIGKVTVREIRGGDAAKGRLGEILVETEKGMKVRIDADEFASMRAEGPAKPAAEWKPIAMPKAVEQKPVTGRKLSGVEGREVSATGADPNLEYKFRTKVVELDDLVPSHTDALGLHPEYPADWQPRMRDRAASELQIDKIARTLNPDAVIRDTGSIDRGSPIVGPDAIVESGNGRVLALRRAREKYPERFEEYRQKLADRAEELGVSEDAVLGMRNPVLVRERVSDVDRPAFMREANETASMSMSAYEDALSDSSRIRDESVATMKVGEDQSVDQALRSPANRDLVREFIGAIPENERARLLDADGQLNQQGLQRLKGALFAKTYKNDAGRRLTQTLLESLDSDVRNIEHAMFQTLPKMARVEGLTRRGERPAGLGISEDLSKAVDMLARLRERGTSVKEFVGQASLMRRELSPLQEKMLVYLDEIGKSRKKVKTFIEAYAESVEKQAHPGQGALLMDEKAPSKKELISNAIERQRRGEGSGSVKEGAQLERPESGGSPRRGGEGASGRGARQPELIGTSGAARQDIESAILSNSYVDPGRIEAYPDLVKKYPDALDKAKQADQARVTMSKVISDQVDVLNAVRREGLGDVGFYWGDKKGGIAHLIEARNAQGFDGQVIAMKMPEVIVYGEVGKPYGPPGGERINVSHDGHTAVLSLFKHGDRETWLLTGWNDLPDGSRGVNPKSAYAPDSSGIQSQEGAGTSLNSNYTTSVPEVKQQRGVRETTITPQPRAKTQASTVGAVMAKPRGRAAGAPVRSPAEIVKSLNDALVPIRTGRYAAKLGNSIRTGIYKVLPQVVRTRIANDLPTTSHEVGHHLETLFYGGDAYKGIPQSHQAEVAKLAYPNAQDNLREGLGEFVRLWMTEPAEAKRVAPNYFGEFEGQLKANPTVEKLLRDTQADIGNWYAADARTRLHKTTSVGENLKDKTVTWSNFYKRWVDEYDPIRRAQETVFGEDGSKKLPLSQDAFRILWQGRGIAGKASQWLKRGVIDREGNVIGKSFDEILKPVKQDIEAFRDYLVAKHGLEVMDFKGEDAMPLSRADYASIINRVSPADRARYNASINELQGFQNSLLAELVDSGLLSQDAYAAIKSQYKYYVPFYRVKPAENVSVRPGFGKRSLGDASNPVKRQRGSKLDVVDPLESIIKNTYVYLNLAQENRARLAFRNWTDVPGAGRIVEKIPPEMRATGATLDEVLRGVLDGQEMKDFFAGSSATPETIVNIFRPSYQTGPNEPIMRVFADGKPELLEMSPELYEAVNSVNSSQAGMIGNVLNGISSVLRAGATLDPGFAARNPMRDFVNGYVNSKNLTKVPVADLAQWTLSWWRGLGNVIKGQVGKSGTYDQFQNAGGATSGLTSVDRNILQEVLDDMLGFSGKEKIVRGAKKPLRTVLLPLQKFSEVMEETTRVAEFGLGTKWGKALGEENLSRQAVNARDLTLDFKRSGTQGKKANQLIAFFNAAVQGTDKIGRQLKDAPAATVGRAITAITVPSVMLYMVNRQHDDYDELPEWVRDTHWVFKGGDTWYRIPKPQGLGMVFGSLPERILRKLDAEDPYAFDGFANAMIEQTAPDYIPTALKPWFDVARNRSFSGGPIIPEREKRMPAELQFGPNSSELAKMAGDALGVSPRQIDYLMRGHLGGVGTLGIQLFDGLAGLVGVGDQTPAPAKAATDLPLAKSFTVNPMGSPVQVDRMYRELGELRKEEQRSEAGRRKAFTQEETDRLQILERASEILSGERRIIRNINEAKDTDAVQSIVDQHGIQVSASDVRQMKREALLWLKENVEARVAEGDPDALEEFSGFTKRGGQRRSGASIFGLDPIQKLERRMGRDMGNLGKTP